MRYKIKPFHHSTTSLGTARTPVTFGDPKGTGEDGATLIFARNKDATDIIYYSMDGGKNFAEIPPLATLKIKAHPKNPIKSLVMYAAASSTGVEIQGQEVVQT